MEINLAQFKGGCECGKEHAVKTKTIIIEKGAIKRMPEVAEALELKSMGCIICDTNTEKYAEIVAELLKPSLYIQKPIVVLSAEGLEASETAVSKAEVEISSYISWFVAVGSGTVHDITRFLANKMKIPFISCPTAVSTDGYAATVTTMSWHGYVKTFTGIAPLAVIADTDIFMDAPYRLTAAGIAETLGKYISLADWQCGKLFLNENYCSRVYELVKTSVNRVFENLPAIRAGLSDAYETLMLSLLMSGVSMQMWGDSRPVSGGEHHLAQFWDMCVINAKPDALHGEKIGVGLLTALRHVEKAKSITDIWRKMPEYDGIPAALIKEKFGSLADSIIKENQPDPLKSVTQEIMAEKFSALKKIIEGLPAAGKLRPHMQAAGCLTTVEDMGLSRDILPDSITLAPFVRRRLTLIRVLKLIKM